MEGQRVRGKVEGRRRGEMLEGEEGERWFNFDNEVICLEGVLLLRDVIW